MSRIYQGGQSGASYKAKEKKQKYSPTKVISNQQAILDEGKRNLTDLKTKDREAKRADNMSNLERQYTDKVDSLVLKEQLDQASRELKLEQQVEKSNQEITKMLAEADLKMGQTTEKGQVSIEQLSDKNALEYKNIIEKNSLELEQLRETNLLKSEHAAKKADNNLAVQHQQLSAQVQNANTQLIRSTISSLISFGNTVATEIQKQEEIKQKKEEEFQASIDGLPSGINVDGTVNPAITDDVQIDVENKARETGIQATASSTTEAQQLRAPALRVETARNYSKSDIRSKANLFPGRLNAALDSPETRIPYNGQEMTMQDLIRSGITEDELYEKIAEVGAYLGNADELTRADGAEALRAYGGRARMAIGNAQSRWGAILRDYNENNGYDSGVTLAATRMASNEHQLAWDAVNKSSYTSGKFIRLSDKERQTRALQDVLKVGDSDDAKAFLNVLKDPNNSGSSFGDDPYYGPIVREAIADKIKEESQLGADSAKFKKTQIDDTIDALNLKLRNTTDPEITKQLREETKDYLRTNFPDNVHAAEQIDALTKQGNQSKTLEMELREDILNGNPPSMAEVLEYEKNDRLTPSFITELKKDIKLADEVTVEMKAAGLGNIESSLKTIVGKYEGMMRRGGITDDGDIKATVAITARQLAPKFEQEMRNFIAKMPKDLPQTEKDRLITDKFEKEMLKITNVLGNEKADQLAFNESGFKFGLLGDGYGSVEKSGRINPITGQMSFRYVGIPISELPKGAGTEDVILGAEDFAADAEVWNQGGSNYSARTIEAAKHLNVTPKAFVEAQAVTKGYDNIHDGIASNAVIDFSSPQTTYASFQAAGLTKKAAVQFGDRVSTMAPTALDDAIESNPVRLERAEKFLGGDFASATPQRKLEAVMNDIKSFDRNNYRILRSPRSSDIQINRAIDEYLKGQQPIAFPSVISTGNSGQFSSQTALQTASVTPYTALPADRQSAFNKILESAKRVGGSNFPEVVAAQAMHETGWLSAPNSVWMASGQTNPFGQTGDRGYGTIPRPGFADGWTVYPDLDTAVADHISLWHDVANHSGNYNAFSNRSDGIRSVAPSYSPASDRENIRLGYTVSGYEAGVKKALREMGYPE